MMFWVKKPGYSRKKKKKKQPESATSIVSLLTRTSTLRHLVVLDDLPRSNSAKVAGRGIV